MLHFDSKPASGQFSTVSCPNEIAPLSFLNGLGTHICKFYIELILQVILQKHSIYYSFSIV